MTSWEIDTVGPALAAAVADLNRWSPDTAPAHPIAAMGEPMLALYDGDPEPRLRRLRSLHDLGGSVGAGGGPAAAGDVRQHARPDGLGRVGLPGRPWPPSGPWARRGERPPCSFSWPSSPGCAARTRPRSRRSKRRGPSVSSSARGVTCPTSAGSLPPSGCGWVTWPVPGPTWSAPSARRPRAVSARATRRPGSAWCAPSSSTAKATPPRPGGSAPACSPSWRRSSRPGGTGCRRSYRPGWR